MCRRSWKWKPGSPTAVTASVQRDPGDILSVEAFTAYELLAEAARIVGLDTTFETVPPPGHVHLNRPNLIVLTNPRLLPFLSQVMEADPHLRYVRDESGWYIVDLDTGTDYRSLRDQGQASDYGYVGRLPRPDGKGTLLYLAGTHAQGTLGAAHFVTTNLADAMKERASAPRDSHPRATLGLFTSTTTREALWTSMTAGSLSG